MGSRGPAKGRGGRPPGGAKKAGGAASTAAESEFAEGLAKLDYQSLAGLAGMWQPLQPQDLILLNALWDAVRRYRSLAQYIHDKSVGEWTFETEKGYCGQIPEVGMLNKTVEQIAQLAARFGMSPADRIRLGAPPKDDKPTGPFAAHMTQVRALSDEVSKRSRKSRR